MGSLTKVECSLCKKGMMIDDARYERGVKIYCSRKRCKKLRSHISRDGMQRITNG